MDPAFWASRWAEGRIGFHEGRPNQFLEAHSRRLGPKGRILVPLCGKAEDLAYIASLGHEVVGIEIVEDAVRAFFDEHRLTPEIRETATAEGNVRAYTAGGITILAGNVFACTAAEVGAATAFWDRAAIIALPPDVRPRYAAHVRGLLPADAPGLVVTIEYAPGAFTPPPFSVGEVELRQHYAGRTLELVGEGPTTSPRFEEAGVPAVERCFAILPPGS